MKSLIRIFISVNLVVPYVNAESCVDICGEYTAEIGGNKINYEFVQTQCESLVIKMTSPGGATMEQELLLDDVFRKKDWPPNGYRMIVSATHSPKRLEVREVYFNVDDLSQVKTNRITFTPTADGSLAYDAYFHDSEGNSLGERHYIFTRKQKVKREICK